MEPEDKTEQPAATPEVRPEGRRKAVKLQPASEGAAEAEQLPTTPFGAVERSY